MQLNERSTFKRYRKGVKHKGQNKQHAIIVTRKFAQVMQPFHEDLVKQENILLQDPNNIQQNSYKLHGLFHSVLVQMRASTSMTIHLLQT